jgi:hypothetical protein
LGQFRGPFWEPLNCPNQNLYGRAPGELSQGISDSSAIVPGEAEIGFPVRLVASLLIPGGAISRLLGQRETFAVDLFENHIAASTQKNFGYFFPQLHGIISLPGFAQNFGAIRVRY